MAACQPSFWAVFKTVIVRAICQTAKDLDWHNKWIPLSSVLAMFPLAWFYLWSFGQGRVVFDEMNMARASLLSLFTVAAFILLVNLTRAPILIIGERNNDIEVLTKKNASLQERLKASVAVFYEFIPGSSYCHESTHYKLARIRVGTDSFSPVERVKVELRNVRLITDTRLLMATGLLSILTQYTF